MKNPIARFEERKFITKEFADALAGKRPHPYLRLHDPVQKALVDTASGVYLERMIRFWREISLYLIGLNPELDLKERARGRGLECVS